MGEQENFGRQFEAVASNLKNISEAANNIIVNFLPQLEQIVSKASEFALEIARSAENWQRSRKQDITVMAESGWYPNWFTFFYKTKAESLDELMINHLNENWEDITYKIKDLCPNRVHILDAAFQLHKSGNYIGSIPLFLSQADGICCETLKSFLFTGNETSEKISEMIDSGQIQSNMMTHVFLEPLKIKNHHNSGISKSSKTAKEKAPNRNGILHGHRKHLDYGSEINSLKCFSLLSFIVFATKDLINET